MLPLYLVPESHLRKEVIYPGDRLHIGGEEAHHIARVSRHAVGELISVTDGSGLRVIASIVAIGRDRIEVAVEEGLQSEAPAIRLRAIQALTKSDRAHECVELLVAAGVDEIIPWKAERSIGKWDYKSSPDKWESWIRAAVKQTRRDRIPALAQPIELSSIAASPDDLLLGFHEEAVISIDSTFARTLKLKTDSLRTITVIIGPEGGLTDREVEGLKERGVLMLRLGSPILRSAQAGAAALVAIQSALSIWR